MKFKQHSLIFLTSLPTFIKRKYFYFFGLQLTQRSFDHFTILSERKTYYLHMEYQQSKKKKFLSLNASCIMYEGRRI